MAYNRNVLTDILRARSLTRSELSARLDIASEKLNEELRREPQPKQSLLNKIARELSVPPFVFYMKATPPLQDAIPDFRAQVPKVTAKSKSTIRSIQWAEGIQRVLADLIGSPRNDVPYFNLSNRRNIDSFALYARQYFGITPQDQIEAKDAKAFYTICRKKIEDKQILVLQDSFPTQDGSGFCIWNASFPIIVINTKKQISSRRLFTLAHELAHALMQQSGISDPFVSKNDIEQICNRFAASFLVPNEYLDELLANFTVSSVPTPSEVARVSRRLKISQQAAVLQLERLGLFSKGSHDAWLSAVQATGNPDFKSEGGGGSSPPPQEKVKLARFGFGFAAFFGRLLAKDRISGIDLYRASGLKPKYQKSYISYTQSLTSDELRTLELDDD